MWLFGKHPSTLTAADLESLVSNAVRESGTLEFKREMYQRRDPNASREMLRDVTSMANAEGGVLIIGVEEDGQGAAQAIVPVPDAEAEAGRIMSSALANIAERIPGLTATRVPVGGGDVILVSIPRSYRRPHMVTADGSNELWVRHDRQKSRMSVAELRAAIVSTEDLTVKAETFVQNRRGEALRHDGRFAITGTPLSLEDGRIDTTDAALGTLMTHPLSYRVAGAGGLNLADERDTVEATIRGVRVVDLDGLRYLEVFRSGHLEFVVVAPKSVVEVRPGTLTVERVVRGWAVAEAIRNFVYFTSKFRLLVGINDPYLIALLSTTACISASHGGAATRTHSMRPSRCGTNQTLTFSSGRFSAILRMRTWPQSNSGTDFGTPFISSAARSLDRADSFRYRRRKRSYVPEAG